MGVNYQKDVLFVGQDIDKVVAMMAYIQFSLLGCPGYIIVGNSLTDMPDGHVLFPQGTEQHDFFKSSSSFFILKYALRKIFNKQIIIVN